MNVDLNPPQWFTKKSMGALVLAAAGFFHLYYESWLLGSSGIVLAILLGFSYKGLGFDPQRKRYRVYAGLFCFRFGAWEPLPDVSGVTVKYFTTILTSGNTGLVRQDRAGNYILMLSVHNSSQGVIIQEFDPTKKDYAVELGQQIAAYLNVEAFTYF